MSGNYRYLYGLVDHIPYDFRDKERHIREQVKYMLCRTQSMFRYENLPETLPARMLELYMQFNGFVGVYNHEGKLYAYFGGLGGKPDEYYMPTILTISNPAQEFSVNAVIGTDCIVIPNDSLYQGMIPLYNRYATAMVENQLSLEIATINTRIVSLISASDDATKESAKEYLRNIAKGDLGVIATNAFISGIEAIPYTTPSSTRSIKDLIEQEQYLKASWFNDVGINANYNMKHENINSAEVGLNDDALLPLVDDMYKCRADGVERVNALFGTEIKVYKNSSWEDVDIESDLDHTDISARAEDGEGDKDEQNPVE